MGMQHMAHIEERELEKRIKQVQQMITQQINQQQTHQIKQMTDDYLDSEFSLTQQVIDDYKSETEK